MHAAMVASAGPDVSRFDVSSVTPDTREYILYDSTERALRSRAAKEPA